MRVCCSLPATPKHLMHTKIVFHFPDRYSSTYMQASHLRLFTRIKILADHMNIPVEVRPRDQRLGLGTCTPAELDEILEYDGLHIIENGRIQRDNVLNVALAYLQPFYHLDAQGVLANSSISKLEFDPSQIDPRLAQQFFDHLQTEFVAQRKTRYDQPQGDKDLPDGCIAVFLQGAGPHKYGTTHCSDEAMLRTVLEHAEGRPVVVKSHPLSAPGFDVPLVRDLLLEGHSLHATEANVHDILAKACVTVSFNSAVAVEGFLHRVPAIFFGKSDLHHIGEMVEHLSDFPRALTRALTETRAYPAFLQWYFREQCLEIGTRGADQKILDTLSKYGFERQVTAVDVTHLDTRPDATSKISGEIRNVTELMLAQPGIRRFRITEVLKHSDHSAVFRARLNGKPVVVKQFFQSNSASEIAAMQSEIDHLEGVFDGEIFQANTCLHAWPDTGLVVLSFARGQRLSDKISSSDSDQRRRLFRRAGKWLKLYGTGRQQQGSFSPRWWMGRLPNPEHCHMSNASDRALLIELFHGLERAARNSIGASVTHSATHGNFVATNIIFHRGTLCGINIKGDIRLPVAREVARFLVHQQISDSHEGDARQHGIWRDDLRAMISSEVIPNVERDTTLPFFIGEQLYGRFVELCTSDTQLADLERCRLAIHSFIEEVPLTGRI